MVSERAWLAEGIVGLLFGNASSRGQALSSEPGLHNVLGLEAAFAERPLDMDFVDPASPFHHLKNLSTKLYSRFFGPFLDTVDRAATALDAGCGVGRFTLALAKRFRRVVAFDPSPSALDACQRHVREAGLDNVELHWADLSFLDELPGDAFDVVMAVELICYTADPAHALRRLVRVTKPGGLILLSVEGSPGALSVQGAGSPSRLVEVLRGMPLLVKEDRFIVFFDRSRFEKLLHDSGLVDVYIEGSHYFGEGPFWQSIDESRLYDPSYIDSIIEAEKVCRSEPAIAPWARVFSAVGRKR